MWCARGCGQVRYCPGPIMTVLSKFGNDSIGAEVRADPQASPQEGRGRLPPF